MHERGNLVADPSRTRLAQAPALSADFDASLPLLEDPDAPLGDPDEPPSDPDEPLEEPEAPREPPDAPVALFD